jgi:hypothetical protein
MLAASTVLAPWQQPHVQVGVYGWLALAALGVAVGMSGNALPGERWLTWVAVLTATAYLAGLAWAGAALAAVAVVLAWLAVASPRQPTAWTVPRLGMAAALAALAAGLVAGSAVTGDAAGALVIPFVILASTAASEWAVAGNPATASPVTTAGIVQVGVLALAPLAAVAGMLASNLALTEANVPLQLGGIGVFLVRVGPLLLTAGQTRGARVWLVTCAAALAAYAGLVAHVVFEVGRQRYASANLVPPWLPFAVDHVIFVGVGTTAFFGAIAVLSSPRDRSRVADTAAAATLALGLAGTAAGIGIGSAAAETVGGILLGLAVLAGVAVTGRRIAGLTGR